MKLFEDLIDNIKLQDIETQRSSEKLTDKNSGRDDPFLDKANYELLIKVPARRNYMNAFSYVDALRNDVYEFLEDCPYIHSFTKILIDSAYSYDQNDDKDVIHKDTSFRDETVLLVFAANYDFYNVYQMCSFVSRLAQLAVHGTANFSCIIQLIKKKDGEWMEKKSSLVEAQEYKCSLNTLSCNKVIHSHSMDKTSFRHIIRLSDFLLKTPMTPKWYESIYKACSFDLEYDSLDAEMGMMFSGKRTRGEQEIADFISKNKLDIKRLEKVIDDSTNTDPEYNINEGVLSYWKVTPVDLYTKDLPQNGIYPIGSDIALEVNLAKQNFEIRKFKFGNLWIPGRLNQDVPVMFGLNAGMLYRDECPCLVSLFLKIGHTADLKQQEEFIKRFRNMFVNEPSEDIIYELEFMIKRAAEQH